MAKVRTNKQWLKVTWNILWISAMVVLAACDENVPNLPVSSPDRHLQNKSIGSTPLKLFLSPSPPLSENDITAILKGGETLNQKVVYEWERNGEIIPYEDSSILGKNLFKKGDTLKVSILPNGGSEKLTSEPAVIENSPPKMTTARIEPSQPTKRDLLKVIVESSDADGDPVAYTYRWFKEDGTEMGSESTISANLFSKGEKVNVEVTPSDGQAKGKGLVATTVIVNAVPKITSTPGPLSGMEYMYQVTAEDPDKDPLTFALRKAPAGMTIDSKTGLIKWTVSEKDIGTFPIEIKVSDPEGAEIIQTFNLALSFAPLTSASSTTAGSRVEK